MPEVGTSQTVPFVLPHLTGRREQVEVTPYEEVVAEIRLERFGGYLSSVDVHGEEVDVVVLGVERILNVRTVVRVVVDAAQRVSAGYRGTGSRTCASWRLLVWNRPCSRRNASDT